MKRSARIRKRNPGNQRQRSRTGTNADWGIVSADPPGQEESVVMAKFDLLRECPSQLAGLVQASFESFDFASRSELEAHQSTSKARAKPQNVSPELCQADALAGFMIYQGVAVVERSRYFDFQDGKYLGTVPPGCAFINMGQGWFSYPGAPWEISLFSPRCSVVCYRKTGR